MNTLILSINLSLSAIVTARLVERTSFICFFLGELLALVLVFLWFCRKLELSLLALIPLVIMYTITAPPFPTLYESHARIYYITSYQKHFPTLKMLSSFPPGLVNVNNE